MSEEILDQATDTQDVESTEVESTGSWRDGLEPELAKHPALDKYKTVNDLTKGFLSAQELIGRKGVIKPKEGDEADKERFYNELGRPETPDGYEFEKNIDIPEEYGYEEQSEVIDDFRATAHKLGLTKEQAQGLYQWNLEREVNMIGKSQKEMKDMALGAETELRKEFGGKYTEKISAARKAVDAFASPAIKEMVDNGLGNHPEFIKMMATIGEAISEDKLVGKGTSFGTTPDEAKKQIAEIRANPALQDPFNPEQKILKDKLETLYKQAYGTK